MIPMMMLGRAHVFPETSAARSAEPDLVAVPVRTHHVLLLSLWSGLVAGPLEVGAIVVRKHTIDLNQFYWMSRHFVWLIPLTNVLIFLAFGLCSGSLASAGGAAAGWRRGYSVR